MGTARRALRVIAVVLLVVGLTFVAVRYVYPTYDELMDSKDWGTASLSPSVGAYLNYIRRHPEGRFVSIATERVDQLYRERETSLQADRARAVQPTIAPPTPSSSAASDGASPSSEPESEVAGTPERDPVDWSRFRWRRNEVRRLQLALSRRGFDPGPPDGMMGPMTESALAAHASMRGLMNDDLSQDDPISDLFPSEKPLLEFEVTPGETLRASPPARRCAHGHRYLPPDGWACASRSQCVNSRSPTVCKGRIRNARVIEP